MQRLLAPGRNSGWLVWAVGGMDFKEVERLFPGLCLHHICLHCGSRARSVFFSVFTLPDGLPGREPSRLPWGLITQHLAGAL